MALGPHHGNLNFIFIFTFKFIVDNVVLEAEINFSHYFHRIKGDAKVLFIFLKILDLNNIMSIWCLFYTQQPNPAHCFNLKQINLGNF